MKKIQDDISKNQYEKAYLLYGEEPYLKIQYKNKLVKALVEDGDTMNYHCYSGKGLNIREIIDLAETMPFFAERRVILLEDTGFFKNKSPELAEYFAQLPDHVCMIFSESEVDKRNTSYKAIKTAGYIAEFQLQNEKTLGRWAAAILGKEGKRITQKDMDLLLMRTGTDMGMIHSELEKLIAYTDGKDIITARDILEITTTQIQNKIFDMVRAVTEHDQKKALDLYYDLLALKEPSMRILFLLSKQYRQLFQVKRMQNLGMAQPEIAASLKLPTFALRNLSSCTRYYTEAELEAAVRDFAEVEEAVKTGQLGDVLSVELMIVKYSSGKRK